MSDENQSEVVAPAITETPVEKPEAVQEKSAPQAENTEVPAGEETQVEKTFTQAELDAILEKKTAKLIRQREQERDRRQEYEARLAQVQPKQQFEKPTLAQFNNEDDFIEAAAQWKANEAKAAQQVKEAVSNESKFATKVADFRDELGELVDLSKFDKLTISQAMAEAILESDVQIKLSQHLVDHPDEAKRIYALSPARQAAEIGKLEARLPTAAKVSKAPAPISPIGGAGKSTVTLENANMEEYIKLRMKDKPRWAR